MKSLIRGLFLLKWKQAPVRTNDWKRAGLRKKKLFDDMHHSSTLGRNWNVLLLPELNETWVRKGMQEGRSYYVYSPSGHNGPALPKIQEIAVSSRNGLIEVNVTGHDSIRWISRGNVVHRGAQLLLKENPEVEKYVRAEIFGPCEVIMGTQPFGIR